MNVACPDCKTVFRVDPAKVPAAGVRARCSVCSGIIPVPAPMEPARAAQPVGEAARTEMRTGEFSASGGAMPWSGYREAPAPAAAPPAAAPAAPYTPAAPHARPQPPAQAAGRRPINPFLAKDPDLRARRLARALVSDIITYHPAKHSEGLRDGTVRELFKDEIRKSYEEYSAQVGQQIAESTPYFQDALN